MKLNKTTALALFGAYDLPGKSGEERPDYHALPSSTVSRLIEAADSIRYRQPKNANASRACYFYGHLGRALARAD